MLILAKHVFGARLFNLLYLSPKAVFPTQNFLQHALLDKNYFYKQMLQSNLTLLHIVDLLSRVNQVKYLRSFWNMFKHYNYSQKRIITESIYKSYL